MSWPVPLPDYGLAMALDDYLKAYPRIRTDVMTRLRRVLDRMADGLLDRLRTPF